SNSEQLNNLVATEQVYRGEQVTALRFGTPTELGIRAQLKGTDRAVQLEGDANELLAGTLKDGDHVDVVAEWTTPDGSQHHSSKVIARNLLILHAPDAPAAGGKLGSPQDNFSVQSRAPDQVMQQIYYARKLAGRRVGCDPRAHSRSGPHRRLQRDSEDARGGARRRCCRRPPSAAARRERRLRDPQGHAHDASVAHVDQRRPPRQDRHRVLA